MKAGSTLWKKH